MGTTNLDELIKLVLQATWSIKEAAHIVHGKIPSKNPNTPSETSSDAVSRTYYWLKKEFEKGRLHPIGEDEKNPRFSPGTIMRHMKEKKRHVSQEVLNVYDSAHSHQAPRGLNPKTKKIYIDAAKLAWKENPDLIAADMAKFLLNLPNHYTKKYLLHYAESTLRKLLRGLGPGKVGGPPSTSTKSVQPDWAKVVTKLDDN